MGSSTIKKNFFAVVILLLFSFILPVTAAEETLCYTEKIENESSFNIYTGWENPNNPILWKHTVPPGILGTVVRVGLYIEAWDVDYPADDEHDRIYFNGHDIGFLEGVNDTWITVEKTIPVSYIREGLNELSVSVDELRKGWKVTIRSSELRFYCSTPEPDYVVGVAPGLVETAPGGTAVYKVVLTPLNGFDSSVRLDVSGFPPGSSVVFAENPVTPPGETILTIGILPSAEPGTYPLKIFGKSGDRNRETQAVLTVKESPCPYFETDIMAGPKKGAVPLEVELNSIITRGTGKDSDYTYDWDLGDGNRSGRNSLTHVYREPGTYTVRLQVTDRCGVKGEAQTMIRADDIPVEFEKTVNRTEAEPGDEIEYHLRIKNLSQEAQNNITVKDILDEGLDFISQTSGLDFAISGRELTWKGNISPSAGNTITIKARIRWSVFNGAKIENSALLSGHSISGEVESNTVSTTVSSEPVSVSKVRFKKRTETPATRTGQIARFSLSIENNSGGALLNPVIEDMLPQGFSYVEGSSSLNGTGVGDPSGTRRLLWALPPVQPGARITLRFRTVIGADVKRGIHTNHGYLTATDNTGKTIRLEDSAMVNVSSDGIIFYSGVQGTVYIDRDRDDFLSPGDTPLEGIEVRISTGDRAVTDMSGYYSFTGLFPGDYAIGINKVSLPEKYQLLYPYPVPVFLNDGLTDTIDFALKFSGEDDIHASRLEGRVFFDRNRNLIFDTGDIPAEVFRAVIDSETSTEGKKGVFVFTHLKPGKHLIEIRYGEKVIMKEIEIVPGKQLVEFPLKFTGIKVIVTGEK